MLKMYDSWGNTRRLPANSDYKAVGLCFNDFMRPMEKHPLFDEQLENARLDGLLPVAYVMWRGPNIIDPERLAEWVLRSLPSGVVVAGDYEDKYSIKGIQAVQSIEKFGSLLFEEGNHDLSYTAPWWWDVWITPYDIYFDEWSPYDHDLWQCDPFPYGKLPGDWTEWAVRQYVLNKSVAWANAAIDEDDMTDEFYNKHTGGGTVPPSQPVRIEVHVPQNVTVDIKELQGD